MIRRKKFNKAVESFELIQKMPLEKCLQSVEVTRAFFENPIIRTYLSRKDRHVTFAQRHPRLIDSKRKHEHAKTDHYELTIYKYKPLTIAYRSASITSAAFYNSYTYDETTAFFTEKLKRLNDKSHDIMVNQRALSADEVSNEITRAFMQPHTGQPSPRFRIYSITDNAHRTTLLVVMHPTRHHPLVAISINSSSDDDHFMYIKNALLQKKQFIGFNSDRNLLKNQISTLFVSISVQN